MKKFFKNIALLLLLGSIAIPSIALAATDEEVLEEEPAISLNVSKISLSKTEYSPGEDITGTFTIENHSAFALPGLSFRVQIGSSYKEPMPNFKYPEEFLDASAREGSINIGPGQSKLVNFTYRIPAFLAGDKLGVNINVYSDTGMTVGTGDSEYIRIKGNGSLIETQDASIVLSNGSKFDLLEGPTIYKKKDPKTAYIELKLRNKSNESQVVYPHVFVHESKDTRVTTSEKETPIELKAGETKTARVALPNMQYRPGVYFAEILLLDSSGNQMESRIGARYIVDGNIATVHSVIVDKDVLSQNEKFNFSATLTGKPFDIALIVDETNSSLGDDAVGKMEVRIYNERNREVASFESEFYVSGETYVEDEFYAKNPAKALRVEIDVYDDTGELLTSYKQVLSPDFETVSKEAEKSISLPFNAFKIALWAIVILVILLIIYLFATKRNKTGSVLIVLLILGLTLSLFVDDGLAKSKRKKRGGSNVGCSPAYVTVRALSPYVNEHFAPGAQFTTRGVVTYSSCNNSATRVSITVTGPKGDVISKPNYFSVGAIGGHGWTSGRSGVFVIGPFQVPNEAGTYYVNFNVHNQAGICGTNAATRVPIIVDPTLAPPPVGCSGGQYYCELFRQCVPSGEQCNEANPNYVPFDEDMNPAIPARIGPVSLRSGGLVPTPPIGNSGYTCRVAWNNAFASYDTTTLCTFSGSGVNLSFKPSATTSPTFYDAGNIRTDTSFKMTCRDGDTGTPQETTAICRLNWNYVEVN